MIVEGIQLVLNPVCLGLTFGGVIVGIIFGALPGLSATMAVVLFLPMTFGMEPVNGISTLVGLYIGGISGGLISAILIKIPGTPASICTVWDGGPMADRGEAGKALGAGIFYSFLGGGISILALIFVSPALASVALKFTPVEYFSISIFSLCIIASLSGRSLNKGLLSGLFGLALTMVGIAPVDGYIRYTYGIYHFLSGFDIITLLLGLYAVCEIVAVGFNRQHLADKHKKTAYAMKGFGITLKEFKSNLINLLRSSAIGIGVGILPGIGGTVASLLAYNAEVSVSKHPERFGKGALEGIIASETANNAMIGGSFIPLLTLGIPGNTTTAVFLGGLLIHGISPGPLIFQKHGPLMYGIFTALIIANLAMLLFETAGLKIFVKLLDIPKHFLFPVIMVLCFVGAYTSGNRIFDVWCVAIFGLIAILFKWMRVPFTPLVIGFVLGKLTEENLRRALMASDLDWSVFVTRPISLIFLLIGFATAILAVRKNYRSDNQKESAEDDP
jgi:putative tricarboxylic transport membrane protein